MKPMPSSWLQRSQALASSTMSGEIQILQYTAGGADRYGEATAQYPAQPISPAGITVPSTFSEAYNQAQGVPLADYVIRLPRSTAVDAKDRIRILGMHGQQLGSSLDCEIMGPIHYGLTAITVKVRVITSE